MILISDRNSYGLRDDSGSRGSMALITLTCSPVFAAFIESADVPVLALANTPIHIGKLSETICQLYSKGDGIPSEASIIWIPIHRKDTPDIPVCIPKDLRSPYFGTMIKSKKLPGWAYNFEYGHYSFNGIRILCGKKIDTRSLVDNPVAMLSGDQFMIKSDRLAKASDIARILWKIRKYPVLTERQAERIVKDN